MNFQKIKKTAYVGAIICGMLLPAFFGNSEPVSDKAQDVSFVSDVAATKSVKTQSVRYEDFTDIDQNAWYCNYVKYLVENGVIKGTSSTAFSPNGTFTVAECATVISRYLGFDALASEFAEKLASSGNSGSALWYAGFMQVMCDTKIMDAQELSIEYDKSGLIKIKDPEKLDTPVSREKFASYITRSFELDSSKYRARNDYYELFGLGHEFIAAGAYDNSYLEYASTINDYWSIDEKLAKDVLKAYYNGIFNGDNNGNFNPKANLTRAEMSKVITVILDRSQRIRNELRTLPESCAISQSDYFSGANGEPRLKKAKSSLILHKLAENISVNASNGALTVGYTHENIVPDGYFASVDIFRNVGGAEILKSQMSACTVGAQNTPYTLSEKFSQGESASVLLRLCDASQHGETVGALKVNVAYDGVISFDDLYMSIE